MLREHGALEYFKVVLSPFLCWRPEGSSLRYSPWEAGRDPGDKAHKVWSPYGWVPTEPPGIHQLHLGFPTLIVPHGVVCPGFLLSNCDSLCRYVSPVLGAAACQVLFPLFQIQEQLLIFHSVWFFTFC